MLCAPLVMLLLWQACDELQESKTLARHTVYRSWLGSNDALLRLVQKQTPNRIARQSFSRCTALAGTGNHVRQSCYSHVRPSVVLKM